MEPEPKEPQNIDPNPSEPPHWLDSPHYAGVTAEDRKMLSAKYKTEPDFVKGSLNAIHKVGEKNENSVEIPKEGDPQFAEKMKEVNKRLGWPEKPEDYEVVLPEVPESLQNHVLFNEESTNELLKKAHEFGASKSLVEKMLPLILQTQLQTAQAIYDARVKAGAELGEKMRKEMGDEEYAKYFGTDEKDSQGNPANIGLVRRMLMNDGGEELYEELEATGLGNAPHLNRWMVKVAKERVAEGDIDKPGSATIPAKPDGVELTERQIAKQKWPHSPYMWPPKGPKDKD
jgi:hypothetical protein